MWTEEQRARHAPRGRRYPSDLTDAERALITPMRRRREVCGNGASGGPPAFRRPASATHRRPPECEFASRPGRLR